MQGKPAVPGQENRALLNGTAEECTTTERSEAVVHGSAGAVPSNTAPANCRVLRYGIDSLYLSFQGELSDTWAGILDGKKAQARSDKDHQKSQAWASILDHQFTVGPFGRNVFRYILQDNAYRIELAGLGAKRVPLAYSRIASEWLTSVGAEQAVAQLRTLVSTFGTISSDPMVTRADLCVDFITETPIGDLPQAAWVTRAREFDRHFVGGKFSGISIGRGGFLSARLYDKTLEIETSGKHYMRALWHLAGWQPGQQVFRLEFQFRREALRELGVASYSDLQANWGHLWRYASESWLRLSEPSATDTTKSRWPTHPLWQALQAVGWTDAGKPERNPARKDRAPSDEKLVSMYGL